MSAPVHIVSIGARTPVGSTAAAAAAAVRAGVRRLGEHPFMVDGRGDPLRAAMDADLDPKLFGVARIVALARVALDEALAPLDPRTIRPGELEVLLALPESRPGFSDADAGLVARQLADPSRGTQIAGRGHAGALEALRLAVERVSSGRTLLCAIVGADSYFTADTVDWLESYGQIAGEGIRNGFIPGEGAGCLLVATRSTARSLHLASLCSVRGVQSAREANLIKGDAEGLGDGLTQAIQGATAALRLPAEAIDQIYCDINGERYRTDEWVFAMLRVSTALRLTDYLSGALSWGDVGAASGALLCILAVRAWARRYAKGPRALVWCSSEGGLRSAAVLERDEG